MVNIMLKDQEVEYARRFCEISNEIERIRKEIHKEFKDFSKIQKNVRREILEIERELSSSMKHKASGNIKEAMKILSKVETRLEEAHFNAWKKMAEYVQEEVENSINGLFEKTADLDFFHRMDIFNELISSSEKLEKNEAIENYKKALFMKEYLWRDIDLIKKKSSYEYFYKIALPITICSVTIASILFTRQIDLMILAILVSSVISIMLFSFLKGKFGKEGIGLLTCFLVMIWLGASVAGIDIESIIFSTGISGFLSVIIVISLQIYLEAQNELRNTENEIKNKIKEILEIDKKE